MLTQLRQNKDNWILKGLLGIISLSFAAFFGLSSFGPKVPRQETPALVNGEPIPALHYSYLVSAQTDRLQGMKKDGKLPESFLNNIRESVLNSMIDQELIQQDTKSLGIMASTKELVDFIKKNPQFQRDGQFDINYYTNRFLPGYQAATGISYEKSVLRDLAVQKLFDEFESSYSAHEKEVALLSQAQNTRYKYDIIRVRKKAKDKGQESAKDEGRGTKDDEVVDEAKMNAEKVWAAWTSGKNIEPLLKELKLSKRASPEYTVDRLKALFGGDAPVEWLKEIVQLSADKPFPAKYFEQGQLYYLVKFVEKKTPAAPKPGDEKAAEEAQRRNDALAARLNREATSRLQEAYLRSLKDKAEIQIRGRN